MQSSVPSCFALQLPRYGWAAAQSSNRSSPIPIAHATILIAHPPQVARTSGLFPLSKIIAAVVAHQVSLHTGALRGYRSR